MTIIVFSDALRLIYNSILILIVRWSFNAEQGVLNIDL